MIVTTGALGSSRLSSTSSSGSSSSSTPTISASYPSSAASRPSASSDNDCDAVAMSPSENRIFTTSATPRPVLSATSWGVDPWTSFKAGNEGPAGSGAGVGSTLGAASAAGVGGSASATGSGFGAAGGVSGSRTSFLFLGRDVGSGSSTASLILASGTALPPEARSRGTAWSGTDEEAVRPSIPISFSDASSSLLATPSSLASS